MKKINIQACLSIQLLLLSVQCILNDYIWLNYGAQMPLSKINSTFASASIPCEVRIGSCSINYTLLPLGWAATPDGRILFPLSDISKSNLFAIKATLTDIFNDQIQADLVVFIQNGVLTVKDRTQFLASNGFDPKASLAKPLQQLATGQAKKVSLQGFPSTDQLQSLIKFGNIYTISSKLKEVSEKYAPCQDRIAYLLKISEALKKKIVDNEIAINTYRQEVEALSKKIADLETQKKQAQNKLLGDKIFSELQKNIKIVNSTRNQLQSNVTRYQYLSSRYLANLNNLGNTNSTQEEIEISKMEDEVKELSQAIEEAMKKKNELELSIKSRRASLKPKEVNQQEAKRRKESEDELMRVYESKYRQYSDLALNSKIKLQSANQQYASLTAKYKIKALEVADLEKQLGGFRNELKSKQSVTAVQAQQEQIDVNEIFKLSADNMLNKINLLNATQCGY